jgi:hypothetical protein
MKEYAIDIVDKQIEPPIDFDADFNSDCEFDM